jgi:hypothetical protein
MLKNATEVQSWISTQEDVVILLSAYLAPIKEYLSKCESDTSYVDDMNGVYQLHTLAQNFDDNLIFTHLRSLDLEPYYKPLTSPQRAIVTNVTNQTISTRKRSKEDFLALLHGSVKAITEIVMSLAKVPPPQFSVTLVAGTPFNAYLLMTKIISSALEYIYIADNYIDATIFDRYLYRSNADVQIALSTNPKKWKRKGWKEQFEQAEQLFRAQHSNYKRIDRDDLHARYIITETGGWRIDGSIKDIAAKTDCPVHTLLPDECTEILNKYFVTESV